jgi:shikimate kinase
VAIKHVVLVGLSGSGKSTVGLELAGLLDRAFVDTDELIASEAGTSIADIFDQQGEAAFRERERQAVRRALDRPPAVLATGGGAPLDTANRAALWDGNLVVWLDAPVEVLVARLGTGGVVRPLLAGAPSVSLAALRAAREPIYATAHARVDTSGLTPLAAARQIASLLESLP